MACEAEGGLDPISALANKHGGLLSLDHLPEQLQEELQESFLYCSGFLMALNIEFPDHALNNVEFFYYLEPRINASAAIVGGREVVGISVYSHLILRSLIEAIIDRGELRYLLGTQESTPISTDNTPPPQIDPERDMKRWMGKDDGVDEIDLARGRDLLAKCVGALIHHEIGHLWDGHLEYVSSSGSSANLDAAQLIEQSSDFRMAGLELDADARSTASMFAFIDLALNGLPAALERMDVDARGMLIEEMVARFLCIRMHIQSAGLTRGQMFAPGVTHPPVGLRMACLLNQFLHLVQENAAATGVVVLMEVRMALENAETVFCNVFGCERIDWFGEEVSSFAKGLLPQVAEAFNSIVPELRKYNRGFTVEYAKL